MSFNSVVCGHCFHEQTYYQVGTRVPPCPKCGVSVGTKPLTSEEYYRGMGLVTKEKQNEST